jgi:hypothetical protein
MGTSDGPRLRPAFNLSSEAAAPVSLSKADAPLLDQRDGLKWNPKIQSQAERTQFPQLIGFIDHRLHPLHLLHSPM